MWVGCGIKIITQNNTSKHKTVAEEAWKPVRDKTACGRKSRPPYVVELCK